jgi:acetyl-CoA carboxylase beta subunit
MPSSVSVSVSPGAPRPADRGRRREHGMVDMVVHHHELRATLSRLCYILTKTLPRRPG